VYSTIACIRVWLARIHLGIRCGFGIAAFVFAVLSMSANLVSAAVTQDRIIVSGASGQLGQLVVKALIARGIPPRNLGTAVINCAAQVPGHIRVQGG
jgi:hypothetical protein